MTGRVKLDQGRLLWIKVFNVKGTASITRREIDPSHVKETSFTCSLVINLIQKSCL